MTEDQWNSCQDPEAMVRFMWDSGQVSKRKVRLFAVACCRRIWPLLTKEKSRKAVEVSERYADGLASKRELKTAEVVAGCVRGEIRGMRAENAATAALNAAGMKMDKATTLFTVDWAAGAAGRREQRHQASLLRDIFGPLPFHSVPISESWLHWSDGTVVKIAQAIYDERRFEDVPILADALEEVGCDDVELLGHLRGPGPHVKGCWAIDLLLGKV